MLLYNPVGKGTYWRALFLARGLARRGHKAVLMATPQHRRIRFHTRQDSQEGVTLVTAPDILGGPLRFGWDPYNALNRINWIRGTDFDLIHGFECRPTVIVPALHWKHQQGGRLVLDWCDRFGRGGSVEERPNPLTRAVLRPVETYFEEHFRSQADGTTVINNTLGRRALELGVPFQTILRLPNGSNVEELHPIDKGKARQALGLPQGALLIGYVGAIFHRDAALMAEAFNIVHQEEPRTRLLLMGYCNVAVEELVQTRSAVWRTGRVGYSEINQYLAACDLCWLPMRDSGANRGRSPLKVKDYMAAGRAVVTTDVGDVADLVRRGGFGVLAHDQPAELAWETLKLLRLPEEREAMGKRARQLAETDFSWYRIAGRLERFYEDVLG